MTPTLEILKANAHKLILPDSTDCETHHGWQTKLGYRQFQFNYLKNKYCIEAHRAAYMIKNNVQLRTEEIVMHSCDNPGCFNPKHLSVGTHNDNVQDRVSKNRSAAGMDNGRYVHGKYIGRTARQKQVRLLKILSIFAVI